MNEMQLVKLKVEQLEREREELLDRLAVYKIDYLEMKRDLSNLQRSYRDILAEKKGEEREEGWRERMQRAFKQYLNY